jgi:thioredoxin
MKNVLLLLIGGVSLIFCSSQQEGVQNLSPLEFRSNMHSNAILLDVRTAEEVAGGQINGASHLDFYDANFYKKIALIQKDKEVFVYCKSGGRSSKAARTLKELGHPKVYNLDGGILSWKKNNLATTKATKSIASKAPIYSQDSINKIMNGQSVVLAFQTKWCAPCRKMVPIIADLEKQYTDQIEFVKIDLDANEKLSEQYKVVSVPTFIYLKDGQEVWRKIGFQDKTSLEEAL